MSTLPELLGARMGEQGHGPGEVAALTDGLSAAQVESYLSGERFPTNRKNALGDIARYLGLEPEALQALKPARKPRAAKADKPAGKPGGRKAKKGPALATLSVFGQRVDFDTVDELSAYLGGEHGEISIEIMGRKLVFGSVGEVGEWVKQFEALFAER